MRVNQPAGGISFAFQITARANAALIRHKIMFPAETFDTFETGTGRLKIGPTKQPPFKIRSKLMVLNVSTLPVCHAENQGKIT